MYFFCLDNDFVYYDKGLSIPLVLSRTKFVLKLCLAREDSSVHKMC